MDLALTVVGATVLVVGLFSYALKKTPLQEPLIGVAVGIAAGPHGFGWLDVSSWADPHELIEQTARVTLAIGLMAVALRISADDLRRYVRPVTWLLTFGMLGMWAVTSVMAGWLLGIPVWSALLLGAVLTPTDPVVASSIVTGDFARKRLPRRIRSFLSLESGANDGLAYLFVLLPILMIGQADEPWQSWIAGALLRGVVVGAVLGAAIGFGAGKVLHWAHRDGFIESYSFLTFTTTLSLFTLGAASLLHADALIAVFIAGLTFNLSTDTGERHEEERIQESMSKLFTLPMFVLFGLAAPLDDWARLGAPLAALAAATLLLRRLPVVALLYPALRRAYTRRDAAFIGWFGPLGIAAVYYSTHAVNETGQTLLWTVASAVIAASILVHGMTAAPLTRAYSSVARSPTGSDGTRPSGTRLRSPSVSDHASSNADPHRSAREAGGPASRRPRAARRR
jgi:NhaP-type Na+/H+ or K+/H+ antiporter